MVNSSNGISLRLPKNISFSQRDYGKLIWPGFYRPLKGIQKHKTWLYIQAFILFSILIVFFYYVLDQAWKRNDYILYLLALLVLIEIITFIVNFLHIFIKKTDWNLERLIKNGALDWDIYDNGLMRKYYSKEPVIKVEQEFISFETLSKIYLNTSVSQVEEILALICEAEKNCPEFKIEDYIINDDWRKTIQQNIYFIGTDGKLIDHIIEKEYLFDQKRFEVIMRERIKKVI